MGKIITKKDIFNMVMESVERTLHSMNEVHDVTYELYNAEDDAFDPSGEDIAEAYEIIDGYMDKISQGIPLSREQIETLKYKANFVAQHDGNQGMETYNDVMAMFEGYDEL